MTAHFHLPGLFEFYDFYRAFLPLFYEERAFFYDWAEIGSIYGAPADSLWGGGRVGYGDNRAEDVLALLREYGISARLTFSNSLLRPEHLNDRACNRLLRMLEAKDGVIVHSDLLARYLQEHYPELSLISSTTKVLTQFSDLRAELGRPEFRYVVPDFRLNRRMEELGTLTQGEKDKVEFLCNECCWVGCQDRRACYEAVSRRSLGLPSSFICRSPGAEEGYRFSKAMQSPAFIGANDIRDTYLPMGFSNFKIEGRSLGSALILEFLLHYLTKPEYQLNVREKIYLSSTLDLF